MKHLSYAILTRCLFLAVQASRAPERKFERGLMIGGKLWASKSLQKTKTLMNES